MGCQWLDTRRSKRNNWGAPEWIKGFYCDDTALWIPNAANPDMYKNLWLVVKYTDKEFMESLSDPYIADPLNLKDKLLGSELVSKDVYDLTVTWHFKITPQPPFEIIQFTNSGFHDLCNVESLTVATQCVPEPSSLIAFGSGLFGLAGMIIKRKKHKIIYLHF